MYILVKENMFGMKFHSIIIYYLLSLFCIHCSKKIFINKLNNKNNHQHYEFVNIFFVFKETINII